MRDLEMSKFPFACRDFLKAETDRGDVHDGSCLKKEGLRVRARIGVVVFLENFSEFVFD
jgi:hypothetical protein